MAGLTKSRSANGQFPKGQSGNPGGRPRDEQKVAEFARSYTREAIETVNPFANTKYGNAKAPVKRMPIPIESIHKVQKLCVELDDDIRWIIAVVSDSGMRLAEVIGLTASDVHLDEDVPFVRLSEHPWRRLKNAKSEHAMSLLLERLCGA